MTPLLPTTRSRNLCMLFALMLIALIAACTSTTPANTGTNGNDDNNSGITAAPTRESTIPNDAVKMTPTTDRSPPVLHSSEFEQPVSLPSTINTAGAEDSPFITPDGSTLYFFFTPDVRVPVTQQLFDNVTGIYVSRKSGDVWGAAYRIVLQDAGRLALDGCEFVDGTTMWFCSAREGYEGIHWFTAQYTSGRWTNVANSDFPASYEVGELHIYGDELYYHSPRSGGAGGLDVWVSQRTANGWQEPMNVAAINTDANEGWPYVSSDGSELWFLRTYLGTPALYRSLKINGAWGTPELIVSQFAGEPTLDDAGNLYFVHHYYRDNNMIEADIYFAKKK